MTMALGARAADSERRAAGDGAVAAIHAPSSPGVQGATSRVGQAALHGDRRRSNLVGLPDRRFQTAQDRSRGASPWRESERFRLEASQSPLRRPRNFCVLVSVQMPRTWLIFVQPTGGRGSVLIQSHHYEINFQAVNFYHLPRFSAPVNPGEFGACVLDSGRVRLCGTLLSSPTRPHFFYRDRWARGSRSS